MEQIRYRIHLKEFNWDLLLSELSKYTPLLKSFLSSETTRTPRSNTHAVIRMCTAILLHNRNRNLNLVQKIHSLILYSSYNAKGGPRPTTSVSGASVAGSSCVSGKSFAAPLCVHMQICLCVHMQICFMHTILTGIKETLQLACF